MRTLEELETRYEEIKEEFKRTDSFEYMNELNDELIEIKSEIAKRKENNDMTNYTISKNGYYFKEDNGKKVRIGKAEYESAINTNTKIKEDKLMSNATINTTTEKENTAVKEQNIINAIKEELGNDLEVSFVDVPKNNIVRRGITIRNESNVAPTIYIDDLTDENEIVARVIKCYKESGNPGIDTSELANQLTDWNWVSERIVPFLFNTEKSVYTDDVLTMPFTSDIGILFKIPLQSFADGVATVKVTTNFVEKWNVSNNEILATAIENIAKEMSVKDLQAVLMEMMGADFADMFGNEPIQPVERISVMTNASKVGGASSILAIAKAIENGELEDQDYYIIPSSVHEVLIVNPDAMTPEQLNQMIHEVNTEAVSVEDFLSDYALKYDSATGEFMKAVA